MKKIVCLLSLFALMFSLAGCKPKFSVNINQDVKEYKSNYGLGMGEDVTVTVLGGGYTEVDKTKINIYANVQVEVNQITLSKYVFIELLDGDGNVLKTNMISIGSNISKGTHVQKTEFKDIEIQKTTYTVRIKPDSE